MAAVAPTIREVSQRGDESVYLVTWSAVGAGDTCNPVSYPKHNDVSIQVEGTFGGATVTLGGSNDGVNYEGLRGPDSVAISLTAAGLKAVLEHTLYTRPIVTGGAGTALNISMLFHFANPMRT
jgi:hypothetical protein